AILFVAEKPVSRGELARVAGATPRGVETALAELGASYEGTGLRLQNAGDEWQIVTAPDHAPQVAAYLGADRLRLSPASLETLAVVAYRQPVTRAEVEAIRGVNCDQTIYTLSSRRLIEERGRKETAGRPTAASSPSSARRSAPARASAWTSASWRRRRDGATSW